jgi:hypothetical protein
VVLIKRIKRLVACAALDTFTLFVLVGLDLRGQLLFVALVPHLDSQLFLRIYFFLVDLFENFIGDHLERKIYVLRSLCGDFDVYEAQFLGVGLRLFLRDLSPS